jgi:hypothetical protein
MILPLERFSYLILYSGLPYTWVCTTFLNEGLTRIFLTSRTNGSKGPHADHMPQFLNLWQFFTATVVRTSVFSHQERQSSLYLNTVTVVPCGKDFANLGFVKYPRLYFCI